MKKCLCAMMLILGVVTITTLAADVVIPYWTGGESYSTWVTVYNKYPTPQTGMFRTFNEGQMIEEMEFEVPPQDSITFVNQSVSDGEVVIHPVEGYLQLSGLEDVQVSYFFKIGGVEYQANWVTGERKTKYLLPIKVWPSTDAVVVFVNPYAHPLQITVSGVIMGQNDFEKTITIGPKSRFIGGLDQFGATTNQINFVTISASVPLPAPIIGWWKEGQFISQIGQ